MVAGNLTIKDVQNMSTNYTDLLVRLDDNVTRFAWFTELIA